MEARLYRACLVIALVCAALFAATTGVQFEPGPFWP